MTYEQILKIEKLKAYYSGLRDGITMYAHWLDGQQYVGTCGKSLKSAIKQLNGEEEQRLKEMLEDSKQFS